MADLSNISLSSNIGDVSSGNSGNQYQQTKSAPKKESSPSKLRVGEIVRGSIVDRIDDHHAFVRIPTGTFKAIVSNNLKKDDSLLFKVIETSPNLILKVYEVSTSYSGVPVSAKDLLRILDLPNQGIYLQLIEIMRKSRKSILRDDVIEIYKMVSKAEKEFSSHAPMKTVLKMLDEMQFAKLPLSYNLIIKLLPLFISENSISEYLNQLEKTLEVIPENLRKELSDFFQDIKSNKNRKNNMFILSIGENQRSFFDILMDISDLDIDSKTENSAIKLRDFIASLSLWNIISFSGKIQFQYILPYYFEGSYYIIRIKKKSKFVGEEESVDFSFSIPNDNSEATKARVIGFQNQLKIYLQTESNKIIKRLERFRNDLDKALSQKNFKLESLKIGLEEIETELNQIGNTKTGDRFTIVV